MPDTTYAFGGFVLDSARYELRSGSSVVHVEPQVFDLLTYLIDHRSRVVRKEELLDAVWGSRFVSDSALSSRLKDARRAVGDDGVSQRVIRTVIGRGYQFVAEVTTGPLAVAVDAGASDGRSRAGALTQTIHFCTAPDGARLAWARMGGGPPLLKAANWMTHLDLDLDSPVWGHWLHDLSRHHTLVRYDERGCGLSDWDVSGFGFDDWVEDLRLVADEAGLERFPLLGISQGAAVAVAFAARFPERVSHLVLVSSYGRGRMVRSTTEAQRREAALDLELASVGWQRDDPSFRQVFTSQFLPDANQEQWDGFNDLQRRTTSPENAVEFLRTFGLIDVTKEAAAVQCPTLFLHSRGDLRQPLDEAKGLAATIGDSRLVTLPSRNHLVLADEPAWPLLLDTVENFLAD